MVIVKVHCFSVVFCRLHALLTSYIIFFFKDNDKRGEDLLLAALLCKLIHGWLVIEPAYLSFFFCYYCSQTTNIV